MKNNISLYGFLLLLFLFFAATAAAQTRVGDELTGRSIQRYFGASVDVSADGRTMVIGEPDFVLVNDTSRVYVYRLVNGAWELDFTIFDSVGRSLGSSVAVSADGNTVVMGAIASSNDEVPYVAVFGFDAGSGWTQRGQTIFAAAGETELGCSVDISADGSIIALAQCAGGAFVQVYRLQNGQWTERGGQIEASATRDRAVALSADGNRLAVGAPRSSITKGQVKVFEFSQGNYAQIGQTLPGVDLFDEFGAAVDLSNDGKRLMIGVPGGNSGRGVALLLEETNGNWQTLGNPFLGPAGNNRLGADVAISGDGRVVAFSAPLINNEDGAVFAVERVGTTNTQIATLRGEDEEMLGEAIALDADGSRLVVGAPAAGFNIGRVEAYDLEVMTRVNAYAVSERRLYPNPTTGPVSISGDAAGIREFKLYDLTGRLLMEAAGNQNDLDLSSLKAGAYVLTWREGSVWYRARVVRR